MTLARRHLLGVLTGALCAPLVVRASLIMPVSSKAIEYPRALTVIQPTWTPYLSWTETELRRCVYSMSVVEMNMEEAGRTLAAAMYA